METDAIKTNVQRAFASVRYPGDERLVDSELGTEPEQVATAFRGKTDWRLLDAGFLDSAPDGLASSLSFFSDSAFQFFLPAFLLADLDGELLTVDPAFYLTHGLDDRTRDEHPGRWKSSVQRFDSLSREQAVAIFEYLVYRRTRDGLCRSLDEALANYWTARTLPGQRG